MFAKLFAIFVVLAAVAVALSVAGPSKFDVRGSVHNAAESIKSHAHGLHLHKHNKALPDGAVPVELDGTHKRKGSLIGFALGQGL